MKDFKNVEVLSGKKAEELAGMKYSDLFLVLYGKKGIRELDFYVDLMELKGCKRHNWYFYIFDYVNKGFKKGLFKDRDLIETEEFKTRRRNWEKAEEFKEDRERSIQKSREKRAAGGSKDALKKLLLEGLSKEERIEILKGL